MMELQHHRIITRFIAMGLFKQIKQPHFLFIKQAPSLIKVVLLHS